MRSLSCARRSALCANLSCGTGEATRPPEYHSLLVLLYKDGLVLGTYSSSYLEQFRSSMITTSPVVRAALESDIEQITQLFLDSVDTSVPGITFSADPDYTPDKISPVLQKRLFPPRSHKTYVLELHTGEIVGYGNVKPDGGPNHDEDELDMFFVKVGLGGQGYGSQLMEAIQAEWGEHGLCVHVFQKNTRAIRFYERWGFQLIEGAEEDLELHMANGPKAETACLMRWPRTS